jgi:hypothetical protein
MVVPRRTRVPALHRRRRSPPPLPGGTPTSCTTRILSRATYTFTRNGPAPTSCSRITASCRLVCGAPRKGGSRGGNGRDISHRCARLPVGPRRCPHALACVRACQTRAACDRPGGDRRRSGQGSARARGTPARCRRKPCAG